MTKEQRQAIGDFVESQAYKIGGWCESNKQRYMMHAVVRHNMTRVYEIGVYEGKSAIPIAKALQMVGYGKLYPVDSYCLADMTANNEVYEEQFFSEETHSKFWGHVKRLRLGEFVANLPPTSSYEASLKYHTVADMIHIDGNHSEWCSLQDFFWWTPKLRKGGILVLDDTNRESTATLRKLAETHMEVVEDSDQWMALRKP